jgi:hypothetical protein
MAHELATLYLFVDIPDLSELLQVVVLSLEEILTDLGHELGIVALEYLLLGIEDLYCLVDHQQLLG